MNYGVCISGFAWRKHPDAYTNTHRHTNTSRKGMPGALSAELAGQMDATRLLPHEASGSRGAQDTVTFLSPAETSKHYSWRCF